ncbi:hypothetical protein [Nocardia sp. NPDC052566]|uniref:hypothetical protein n=1 Tax=Nocardia sp. NPDC052566 TaxID=3364330 RepID=UPI0037C7F831
MGRLFILFIVLAGIFSAYAFKNGGVLVGIIFAGLAVAPIVAVIVSVRNKRRGNVPSGPVSGRTRAMRWGAAGVVLLAVGYAVFWTFLVPKESDKALKSTRDLEPGCAGLMARKYFPQTATYGGPGPHPIAIFVKDDSDFTDPASLGSDHPDHWQGAKLDPARVQLIACLDKPDTGDHLTDCEFNGGKLPLYRGTYDVTLYEAKTGDKVAEERITGVSTPKCPFSALTKGKNPKLHTEPDFAEYRSVLGKYVDAK